MYVDYYILCVYSFSYLNLHYNLRGFILDENVGLPILQVKRWINYYPHAPQYYLPLDNTK